MFAKVKRERVLCDGKSAISSALGISLIFVKYIRRCQRNVWAGQHAGVEGAAERERGRVLFTERRARSWVGSTAGQAYTLYSPAQENEFVPDAMLLDLKIQRSDPRNCRPQVWNQRPEQFPALPAAQATS